MREPRETNWHEADLPPEDLAKRIHDHAADIEERHQDQHENNLLYSQLYYNRTLTAFDWGCGVIEGSLAPISRLSENLALNVTDTFFNTITRNKAKAAVVLNDANWGVQSQARALDRYLYAHMKESGYKVTEEMFIDACLFGFGCMRVDVDSSGGKKKLCYTRLFPDDVLIDQRECHADAEPMHVFHRRLENYETAVNKYGLDPDLARLAGSRPYLDYRDKGQGTIVLFEVWRRAYYDFEGKLIPGRHVICTYNQVVLDEEWTETWIPLVFFRWRVPSSGWYAPSLVEEILPYQIRLNEINETIRKAQDIMVRPRLLVAAGSKVNINNIDNEIGKLINYTGTKPEAVIWQAASAELYGERDRVVKSCYEFMGISQLAAQAKMPAGARFDSSLAIREFNTTHDQRWAKLAQAYEQLPLKIGELTIMMSTKYKVNAEIYWTSGGSNAKSIAIDWSKIDLPRNKYVLGLEPASVLNETPSARKDILRGMLADGTITREQYASMYCHPDIESAQSLYAAGVDQVKDTIESLTVGEYIPPDESLPYPDAIMMVEAARKKLLRFKDVPETILEGFDTWLLNAKALVDSLQPEAPEPQMAAAPVTPMAPPQQ